MAEQIYTIPINEAFDEYCGCPLCRLHNKLEQNSLNYIMGAAMMEPDIRIVTNKLGFCKSHFTAMLSMGNRLSMALTLESHLDTILAELPEPSEKKAGRLGKVHKYKGESPADKMHEIASSCYVCQRVADFEGKYIRNVIYIWKKDPAFREKFARQPYFCLEHAASLLTQGQQDLSEENYLSFYDTVLTLCRKQLSTLRTNITAFCRSFDHENAGKKLDEATKKSVEASVAFLSGDFEY